MLKNGFHIQGCSFRNTHLAAAGMKPARRHGKGFAGRELAEVETASHQREQHRAPDSPGTHTPECVLLVSREEERDRREQGRKAVRATAQHVRSWIEQGNPAGNKWHHPAVQE